MKNLSIEEKAKRYDEAIEKAEKWHNAPNVDKIPTFGNRIIEDIFPELYESEDEKIRKELIKAFKSFNSIKVWNGIERTNILTWLEKQGEQKPSWTEDDEIAFLDALWCCKKAASIAKDENEMGTVWYAERWLKSLKERAQPKQGEQKSADKVEPKDYNNIDPHFGKPIDKVEPKFKAGDWVVFNGLTLYINEVLKGYYRTISKGGTPNSYDWNIDNAARLWTIKEAKDGDILWHSDSASNGIFIFKEIRNDGKVLCYCDYDSEDHFCLGEHHTCCWADAKILHPATKEQRETLFEKMKLEGYRWDEDEKKVIQFERFVRRKESDFAFKENENGVIKFVHEKN